MYLYALNGIGDVDSPQYSPAQPTVFVNVPRGVTVQPAPEEEPFPILDFSTPPPPTQVVIAPESPPIPVSPPQENEEELVSRAIKTALIVGAITGIVSMMLKGR